MAEKARELYYIGLNSIENWWFKWWKAVILFLVLCLLAASLTVVASALQQQVGEIDNALVAEVVRNDPDVVYVLGPGARRPRPTALAGSP